MKQQTTTSVNQPNATFVCSTLLNDFLTDDASSRFNLTWNSRQFRESSFAQLSERNRSVEIRLSMANTLVMDYQLHRIESVTENDGYSIYVFEGDADESQAVLHRQRMEGAYRLYRSYTVPSVRNKQATNEV